MILYLLVAVLCLFWMPLSFCEYTLSMAIIVCNFLLNDLQQLRSPGQYCKNSSKSGTVAAQRLVDGRRAFEEIIINELRGDVNSREKRKMYALVGHGIPNSLFLHFISTGNEWLQCQNEVRANAKGAHIAKRASVTNQFQNVDSAIHLALRNTYNSTILDRERILKTNASGTTCLIQWPPDWDHDLELFLVAMNRIGSRLSSVVLRPSSEPLIPMTEVTSSASGSVVTPAELLKWNVTIRKGEVLPLYLLPTHLSTGRDNELILTVEWLYNSMDCWTIILRLQDGNAKRTNASISLVFEGVYVC